MENFESGEIIILDVLSENMEICIWDKEKVSFVLQV
jgi:hypothetical protein